MGKGSDLGPGLAEATRLAHTGSGPSSAAGRHAVTVNPPVQRGSTVLLPEAATMHDYRRQITYGRAGLATQGALCEGLCALEHAKRTFLFPSGAAAITGALMSLLQAGDEVLAADAVYGPTRRLCDSLLARFGVTVRYFDPRASPEAVTAMVGPATRVIMMESPGSLTFEMQDVAAVAAAARARGVWTVIDNTWAAGLLFKPLDHGVDVSVQALTKYVGGHADAFMGSVAVRDAAMAARVEALVHEMGWAVSPDDAYVMLRGLRTLAVRLQRHGESGLEVARWLKARPEVAEVLHPALPESPDHALWARDYTGACGLFGVVLRPAPRAAVNAFLDALQLFGLGFSWGGYESLAISCDPQLARTATPARRSGPLIRLHVGLEAPEDLTADLARGFAALAAASA